ncbi:MAG: cellobiose phosphorylase [Lachnospiraceae bacterium]|nr:cellobiose phosphorylase [Lachnospiraceae bacterium]
MELIHIVENFTPLQDPYLLRKAELLKPVLRHETVFPESLPEAPLGKGDSTVIDFGTYLTGRVSLSFGYTGSHPDAPAHIGLFFAENVRELSKDPAAYHGWVSSSWIQDERLHLDILPANVDLPRRYSFRYLRITVLDTSPKYRLTVKRVSCVTETSASPEALKPYTAPEPLLQRIYDAGLLTLRNCMQDVFEDGPKRDRRLWLGDLRLTALANYASYRNTDLVKRCLYLFAGSRFPDGRISAAVFHTPEAEADDTCLTDYSLLFPVVLEEYLRETGDTEALEDLYGTAMQQMEISLGCVGQDGRVLPEAVRDAFFDWAE